MALRVSIECGFLWPSCLTDLEYSNCCYAADVFHLDLFMQAFAYPGHTKIPRLYYVAASLSTRFYLTCHKLAAVDKDVM